MHKKYFWCLFLLSCGLYAQQENRRWHKVSDSFSEKTEFKASYFGNFIWNPGFSLGAEYVWKEKVKTKERKRGLKTITKQLLLNGSLGVTWDPRTEVGVFANYGLIWRRTNTKGKQISVTLNPLGYYRSFLPETYEVSGDEVNKVFLAGRNYYAPSISVGFGKLRKGRKLTGRHLNLNFMLRTPYNANSLPMISIEYGYRFKLKKKK